MLFVEADAPLVKAWIVKRLENKYGPNNATRPLLRHPADPFCVVSSSDADADVLADYVLALLKHDGDVEAIRKLFEAEIPDFLREGMTTGLSAAKYRLSWQLVRIVLLCGQKC